MTLKRSWMPRSKKRLTTNKPLRRFTALRRSSRVLDRSSGVEGSAGGAGRPGWLPHPRAGGHRLPVDVRAVVQERSGGWCELQLPGCTGRATQRHHRITQKAGGRHGLAAARSDRASNVLDVDASCHDLVGDHPGRAYTYGWSLRERQEPTQEPLLYRGELVYLDDEGLIHAFETAGA